MTPMDKRIRHVADISHIVSQEVSSVIFCEFIHWLYERVYCI